MTSKLMNCYFVYIVCCSAPLSGTQLKLITPSQVSNTSPKNDPLMVTLTAAVRQTYSSGKAWYSRLTSFEQTVIQLPLGIFAILGIYDLKQRLKAYERNKYMFAFIDEKNNQRFIGDFKHNTLIYQTLNHDTQCYDGEFMTKDTPFSFLYSLTSDNLQRAYTTSNIHTLEQLYQHTACLETLFINAKKQSYFDVFLYFCSIQGLIIDPLLYLYSMCNSYVPFYTHMSGSPPREDNASLERYFKQTKTLLLEQKKLADIGLSIKSLSPLGKIVIKDLYITLETSKRIQPHKPNTAYKKLLRTKKKRTQKAASSHL